MCWVAYIASDQPLLAWHGTADDFGFRIDSLDAPISEPTPEGVKVRSPHLSLPHVYLAHVGADCGYSCGLDDPNLRSQIHSVIQQELSKGTRLEVAFSHADYIYADLEFSAALTPSALEDIHRDWELRVGNTRGGQYEPLHTGVPLGDNAFFSRPRRIRLVSESELENVSSTITVVRQRLNEEFRAYVSEWHPNWSHLLVPPQPSNPPPDFVSLILPNPRGEESPALEVRTEDQRLTVCFGLHHAHFKHEDGNPQFAACFDLVEGIVEERIVSVVLCYGDSPYVSDFCHVEDLPAVEEASRPRRKVGRGGWARRLLGLGPTAESGNQTTWRSYGPVHYALRPPPEAVAGPSWLNVHSWIGTHDRRTIL
jgi:hypothetical protein